MSKDVPPGGALKFMTYNIDGLNPAALMHRTKIVLSLILSESPDIVQLQEVVSDTAPLLIKTLIKSGYASFHEADRASSLCHYFTLTFARSEKIKNATIQRIPYTRTARSEQGRDLLRLNLTYMGKQWMFINCHLESCGVAFKSSGSTIRMAQLRDGLEDIVAHSSVGPAILAGDLNIREPEAAQIMSEYTKEVLDASAVVEKGRKSNTWFMPAPSKYSARYDRVYSNLNAGLRPVSFKIIGGDDVMQGTGLDELYELPYNTPSDHRGVVVTYAFETTSGSSAEGTRSASISTSSTSISTPPSKRSRVTASIPSNAEVITLDDSDSDTAVRETNANKRAKIDTNNSNTHLTALSSTHVDSTAGGSSVVGNSTSSSGSTGGSVVLTAQDRRELFLRALEKRGNA